MSKVRHDPNGCWTWTSIVKTEGYPYFTFGMQAFRAHRLSYMWATPGATFENMEGLQIDHLCRNRLCVNPEHLELVTAKENTLRGTGLQSANAQKTHCAQGHPFDDVNTSLVWNNRDRAYQRRCKACSREWARKYAAEKRRKALSKA